MIYFTNPITLRLVIAMVVVLIALLVGIVIATSIWKKQGTMHFLSRVMAAGEIDNKGEE